MRPTPFLNDRSYSGSAAAPIRAIRIGGSWGKEMWLGTVVFT